LYLTTNYSKVEDYSNFLLSKNYDTLEKVNIYIIKSVSYFAQLKQQKAIENLYQALALPKIEIDVPQDEDEIKKRTNQEYKHLELLLKHRQIQDLVDLPQLSDPYKISALLILEKIVPSLTTTNSPLLHWCVLKQINLCIEYGNPPRAVANYICYPLIATSDINLSYEFGQLSLKLQEKYYIPSIDALVIHIYYGFAWHWKQYLRNIEVQEQCINGFHKGRDVGNYEFASYCFISYYLLNLFGGYSLKNVRQKGEEYLSLISKFQIEYSTNYLYVCNQIVNNLIDEQKDFILIGDSLSVEASYLDHWSENNFKRLLFLTYFAKLFLLYFFKQYHDCIDYSIKTKKAIFVEQHNFYSSLTFLANYHNSDPIKQKEFLEEVNKNQEKMKMWIENCRENYQHKYDLVEAEKAKILGQTLQAQELYDRAIEGAEKYEFIHEEALAYERAAEFYFALGRHKIGQFYLRNAHHCYICWGAKAKVKKLEEEYPQYLLGVTDQSKSKGLSTTSSTTGNDGEILDLTTVIKASQKISGEIKLEDLLDNLMKIVIENAGAQIGFLILNHQGSWVIEAQGKIGSNQVNILQSIPIEFVDPETSIPVLPTTIINYVLRTQENIVLNDAAHEGQFINDPYIIARQSKSILCTPLINQKQLRGIIYLENNLTIGTFTSERAELLKILSAQAAISIANSRLYSQVRENEHRLTQFLDAVPVGVAIIDAAGHPYYFNQVAKKLLGKEVVPDITSEQIASTYQFYKINTNQEYPSDELPIIRALQGESLTTEDIYVHKGNQVIPLESFSTPIYDQQGKIIYAINSFIDITERKKAEVAHKRFTNQLFELNMAYERFVPKPFLEFLGKESIIDVELGDQVQLEMSVLFSDVRNFTTMSEAMTPDENFRFINEFLSSMEPAILENQGFIDKYIGDAIMALFSGDADNAVKAGISMLKRLNQYNQDRASSGDSPVRIGIGINTGLLMLGTVGSQNRMDGTVISDAVNLASRVESLTKNYGVSLLITEQTFLQLTQASNYAIRSIDTVKVKGKSQKVTVYEVFDADPPVVKEGKLTTLQQFKKAIFFYNSGQLLEAREMFVECLKLNPRDQVAQIYLQHILNRAGKWLS
ncbi:MAG: GAF domain-containing protein, partial [Trichodesmium sp. MAG_R03]|nr:GAF domain-containing protein [Trichodesmium sp. MAG_R03]